MKDLKAVSPIISTVILILLVIGIAAIVVPWAYDLTISTTDRTKNDTDTKLKCQNTAYDFDTDYANNGVNWSDSANSLKVKIVNTGTINIYDFSFEILYNTSVLGYFNVTSSTQKTQANPLKPSQSVFLQAESTSVLVSSVVNEVKILNSVCSSVAIIQTL